jgi:hypothetical protein
MFIITQLLQLPLQALTDTHPHPLHLLVACCLLLSLSPAVAQLRDEAAAALAQLLPAAAQLAAAREALAAQLEAAEQGVTQHKGRLRHLEEQVGADKTLVVERHCRGSFVGMQHQGRLRHVEEQLGCAAWRMREGVCGKVII